MFLIYNKSFFLQNVSEQQQKRVKSEIVIIKFMIEFIISKIPLNATTIFKSN